MPASTDDPAVEPGDPAAERPAGPGDDAATAGDTRPTAADTRPPADPRPPADTVTTRTVTTPGHPAVELRDTPNARVHHPSDLLGAVLSAVGVVLVVVLATYAHNTTVGVTEDVQGFASLLRRVLFFPVALLELLVTVVAPLVVLGELLARRLGRIALESIAAAVAGVLLAAGFEAALVAFGTDRLVAGMSVVVGGEATVSVPGYVALLGAFLTAAGPRGRRRSVSWSWNLLWASIGVAVITAQLSLLGSGVALLLGRVAGQGVRYLSGVHSERAYGAGLLAGIRRAGFEPARVLRRPDAEHPGGPGDPAPAGWTDHRVYALTTVEGEHLDVVVLDGDRQVVGVLSRLWRSLRLRGIDGRSVVSLRQATERAALLAHAVRAAGVRTPALLALAEAEDSMLLVQRPLAGVVPLADLGPDDIDDALLREVWAQLRRAHDAGIAHRALTSDVVLVDRDTPTPSVWIVGWDNGDIASSELARRMDLTQALALLALRVGATRAMASAAEVLPDDDLAAVGPLLQTITMPRRTRDELRAHKEVLAELRTALVARLPQADVEPEQLVRLGARTLITIVLTAVAVIVVSTSVNINQIVAAVSGSDWRWTLVAFALGLATLLGAALALVAYSPVKIPLGRALLVQSAAKFVALAAPAGIGPAAINLRLLTRRGVSGALAGATVALVQVSQFVVTLVLLVVLSIASGSSRTAPFRVTSTMIAVILVLAVLVTTVLAVPRLRQWVARRTLPTLRQTWPRLIEMLSTPSRLALGLAGNAVLTLGYVFAFQASLAAFGQEVSLVQAAIVYLAGNAAGAVVPTPGGIGAIEIALGSGLAAIGINPGVAASVAVLFRLVTYWLPIPLGWVSMRYLQRVGEL